RSGPPRWPEARLRAGRPPPIGHSCRAARNRIRATEPPTGRAFGGSMPSRPRWTIPTARCCVPGRRARRRRSCNSPRTRHRHSPPESGVIAKAASGALERVPWARVVNLARTLEEIAEAGFWRIGLAGDAETELKGALGPPRVALVLGAEGPGLRLNTREHC